MMPRWAVDTGSNAEIPSLSYNVGIAPDGRHLSSVALNIFTASAKIAASLLSRQTESCSASRRLRPARLAV
jgi:hypothetical protein